ncbi:hypothetical protein [Nonomuraea sp. NPDC050643]|uniref:hypothetical protein n=1 Tax=Nonomuraea sp. NPDC050643 TaxID=3155660 RepID=UPI00340E158E
MAVLFLLYAIATALMLNASRSPVPSTMPQFGTVTPAATCPVHVTRLMPDGQDADLVAGYATGKHDVIICRTRLGQPYYYGQVTGLPGTGLLMPAQETPDGYLARNGLYRYEIRGQEVIVTLRGQELRRTTLIEVAPS